jgi:transmembrane sensor
MKKLPAPVRTILDDTADEAVLQGTWRRIRDRRHGRRGLGGRLALPAFATAAAAAAVWVALWLGGTRAPAPPAPLAVQGGDPLATLLSSRDVDLPLTVRLSDQSRLEVAAGARLAVGENRRGRVSLVLREGTVGFDVTPHGPRLWTIQAGAVLVEVTGTRFTVSRRPDEISVRVERGSVRVTSELLQPAVRELGAGQHITVRTRALAAATTTTTTPSPDPPAATQNDAPRPTRAAAPTWRTAQQAGDHARAYELLGAGGVARESAATPEAGALLALADVARLSGHPREAVEPLRRVARSGDARAPIAAFTLGRVELAELGDPGSAAASFELALRLGLPAGLQEAAHARLVEAHARAGNTAQATRWAEEYGRRFPNGRHAVSVQRWTSGAP